VLHRAAVRVGMMLRRFAGMVCGMKPVSVGDVRMMRRLLMIALLVMVRGFAVVGGRVFVVFSRFSVMFRSLVLHRIVLFSWRIIGAPLSVPIEF
jgi:hypothetical protein